MKSDINKIILGGGRLGGNIVMFKNRFQSNYLFFKSFYNFLSELNNIFHVKGLKDLHLMSNQLTIGERPNKKNIESLNLI